MEELGTTRGATYCVTGASGYIGSWLVKTLVRKGCVVHATVRDLAKASNLLSKWKGGGRVKVFKAELREEGSFDEAVKGCDGVFHAAAHMEFGVPANNIESYVQSEIIDPAVKGTINLLKSCLSSKESVKRVIFTSSISTITAKDGGNNDGNWRSIVDESCQEKVEHIWEARASGWVYCLSKLLSEKAALQFAQDNGIHLVSVITTTVAGPFLTPSVPTSIRVLLSPMTSDPHLYPILKAVNSRMGSISLVHIEDICNAHIFLMEHPDAQGRYMCCALNCHMSQLLDVLARAYQPCSDSLLGSLNVSDGAENWAVPTKVSSKKLEELGFEYRCGSCSIACLDSYCQPLGRLKEVRRIEASGDWVRNVENIFTL